MRRGLVLLAVGAAALAVPPAALRAERPRAIEIVYTTESRGNLLPCACPSAPLGGLARRIGTIDSIRIASADPVFLFDAGAFFPLPSAFPYAPDRGMARVRGLVAEAAVASGYDAIACGPLPTGSQRESPWLRPNRATWVERDGVRLRVVAVDEGVDPAPAARAVAALPPGDLTLLLCSGDYHFAASMAVRLGAQVAIAARGACYRTPVWKDGVLLLGAGVDGKHVGRARLTLQGGAPPKAAKTALRPMDASAPVNEAWERRVRDLLAEIERAYPGAFSSIP